MAYVKYRDAWVTVDDPGKYTHEIHTAWVDLQNLKARSKGLRLADFTRANKWHVRSYWGKDEIFIVPYGVPEWVKRIREKEEYLQSTKYFLVWDLMNGTGGYDRYTSSSYKMLSSGTELDEYMIAGPARYMSGLLYDRPATSSDLDPANPVHYSELEHVYPHYLNSGTGQTYNPVLWTKHWVPCCGGDGICWPCCHIPGMFDHAFGALREQGRNSALSDSIYGVLPAPAVAYNHTVWNTEQVLYYDYASYSPYYFPLSAYEGGCGCICARDKYVKPGVGNNYGGVYRRWNSSFRIWLPYTEEKIYRGDIYDVYRLDPHIWEMPAHNVYWGAMKSKDVYMVFYEYGDPCRDGSPSPYVDLDEYRYYRVCINVEGDVYNYEHCIDHDDGWYVVGVDPYVLECHIYEVPWGYTFLFTTLIRYYWAYGEVSETRELQYHCVNYENGNFEHVKSRVYTGVDATQDGDAVDYYGWRPFTYTDNQGVEQLHYNPGTFRMCQEETRHFFTKEVIGEF